MEPDFNTKIVKKYEKNGPIKFLNQSFKNIFQKGPFSNRSLTA